MASSLRPQALHLLSQVPEIERAVDPRGREPAELRRLRPGPGVVVGLVQRFLQHLGHQIKAVQGRKSDVNDATWLADLEAHGLIRASFVPLVLSFPEIALWLPRAMRGG